MSDLRVTVVIPNWNGLAHLEDCFASLRSQTLREFQVIVIDNASSDGSVQWMKEHEPDVEVVVMPKNGGFSYAVNEGIRRANTEYVALLNNDTAAAPGWLSALVDALDGAPRYDFAASRMVFFDEPDRLNAAGDVFQLSHLAAANRGYRRRAAAFSKPARVFGACAGAALYRRRLFDDLGLFDEDFFLMSEDTDLNFRALVAGRHCLYVPGAVLRHKVSASIAEHPKDSMRQLALRNQMIVLMKDLPKSLLPVVVALWPMRTARALFRFWDPTGMRREWHALPARIAADLAGARIGLKKRGEVRERRVGAAEVMRRLIVGCVVR